MTEHLYCQFDICGKRLKEFCSLCEDNGKYYCSDICAERDLQERTPKPLMVQ